MQNRKVFSAVSRSPFLSRFLQSSFHLPSGCWLVIQVHTANTYSSRCYRFSHDTWLSSATPFSRAWHSGIWLMRSPSIVICLICPAFWDVSKTSLNVFLSSLTAGFHLVGWLISPALLYARSVFCFFFPLPVPCLYVVSLWISLPHFKRRCSHTCTQLAKIGNKKNAVWGKLKET